MHPGIEQEKEFLKKHENDTHLKIYRFQEQISDMGTTTPNEILKELSKEVTQITRFQLQEHYSDLENKIDEFRQNYTKNYLALPSEL